jgi:hypothetical protein
MAKKPEPKTRPTDVDPMDFLSELKDETKKQDAIELLEMMRSVTKLKAVMWGDAIIGFGSKPIKYANGSELDWPMMAFSPRKANLTLYLQDFPEFEEMRAELGPNDRSKGCLYIKRLTDIDKKALKQLLAESFKASKNS